MIVLRRGLWRRNCQNKSLRENSVLQTAEESDHHLLMKALLVGDIETHPSRSHGPTFVLEIVQFGGASDVKRVPMTCFPMISGSKS